MPIENVLRAVDAAIDPQALLDRVAQQVGSLTASADSAAVSMLTPDGAFAFMSGQGVMQSLRGLNLPRKGTFLDAAATTGQPQVSIDAPQDPSLTDQARYISSELGVRSLVVIPLLHRGVKMGGLSITSRARDKFTCSDVATLAAAGRAVSALISTHTDASDRLNDLLDDPHMPGREATARFLAPLLLPDIDHHTVLERRLTDLVTNPALLRPVFQPIVELDGTAPVGYEGLCRLAGDATRSPQQWFDAARALGYTLPLEMAAAQRVLACADDVPEGRFIAINVGPTTVMDPRFQEVVLADARPLVIEITEHEPFPDRLAAALQPLREAGVRVAIDDAGAGYASFHQLLRIRPDIIKIDGSLIAGIDIDPAKHALATAVVQLSTTIGATLVAEGVETLAQKHTLQELGVQWGQGYLFGRPGSISVKQADRP